MAKEGLYLTNCYSPSTYTYPSIPSILTGTIPVKHRILSKWHRSKKKLETIHDLLKKEKWTVSTYSDEPWIYQGVYGYATNCEGTTAKFDSQLPYNDYSFVWLHYWGTHHPWKDYSGERNHEFPTSKDMQQAFKNKDLKKVREYRKTFYARACSRINHYSKQIELMDDGSTLIVLFADHGDDYYLHGKSGSELHASLPFDSVTKIPLVFYPLDVGKLPFSQLNSAIYLPGILFPEIFDAIPSSIDYPYGYIIPITGAGKVFAIGSAGWVTENGIKYFCCHTKDGVKEYCFDLINDPEEQHSDIKILPKNIREELYKRTKRLYPHIWNPEKFLAEIQRVKHSSEEDLIKERLRALGYIE